jgi:vancomycin resistance protein YoaR
MQVLQQEHLHEHLKAFLLGAVLCTVFLSVGSYWLFQSEYNGRFYEGIFIDNVDVSKLTINEARQILATTTQSIPPETITLSADGESIASSSAQLGLHREYDSAINQAFQFGRSQGFFQNIQNIFTAYTKRKVFSSQLAYDPIAVQEFVTQLAIKANQAGEHPKATLKGNTVELFPGKMGTTIVIEEAAKSILNGANTAQREFTAPIQSSGTELTQVQIEAAIARAEQFIGKTIQGKVDVTTVDINDETLVSLLSFPEGYNDEEIEKVLTTFTDKIDRPAQNAKFTYDPVTLKVSEFQPDLDGITINKDKTKEEIIKTLQAFESGSEEKLVSIMLPITAKKADQTLESLNDLGLKERIGFGESYYDHSIPSRIHNVSLASKIINNTIVKPGEEFSFNKALGEVSKATGFQPAYIIQSGQTVLGDGGGVCQVSTTLFRALLDSGLQITKRRPHSYRVSYYELNKDPGFDATVYAGDVDLRFINDTQHHVLLHFVTFPEQRYMYVSIYGTSDGRVAEISDYKKWDARGAPPSVYIDDPTLPPGKVVQIDYAVGGIKAQFKHTVRDKDGNIIHENTYYSNYVPWSAKYRRGPTI